MSVSQSGFFERSRVAFWRFRHRIKTRLAGSITRLETTEKTVALTFDDGPHPAFTNRLLDVLQRHNAKATFFITGVQAERHPEIIERIKQSGHAIGCHSWDHPSFRLIGQRARLQQISRWKTTLGDPQPRLFRPPFGHQTLASYYLVRLLGYKIIMWSALAQDWLDHDADYLIERLENGLSPGAILLLHDNLYDLLDDRYLDRQPSIDAVEHVLKKHSGEYEFVTVPQLLLKKGKLQRKLLFGRPKPEFMSGLHPSSPYEEAR
ncbi:MAG: polysaccharide deacetylase family protein [Gammaproteobacteria bacterium]|nr:polysaccharide deacetylase family protein [Gammaproteobacteria bacterium]